MMKYLPATALLLVGAAIGRGAERPNVVLILADDLGWSDTTVAVYFRLLFRRISECAR